MSDAESSLSSSFLSSTDTNDIDGITTSSNSGSSGTTSITTSSKEEAETESSSALSDTSKDDAKNDPPTTITSSSSVSPSAQDLQTHLNSQNKNLCPSTSKRHASSSSSSKSFGLANTQSFGFFTDIPCESWNRMRQITTSTQIRQTFNPDLPNSKINYEPNFSCQFKQRIGGYHLSSNSPKWLCDPHRFIDISTQRMKSRTTHKTNQALFMLDDDELNAGAFLDEDTLPGCVIYSIGINGDFNFEKGVQNLLGHETCEIHIFDMIGDYKDDIPAGLNLHFHHWGITYSKKALLNGKIKSSQASYEGNTMNRLSSWFGFEQQNKLKTLEETVKLLGHEHLPAIDVLNIDCNGCEWDIYKDWFSSDIPRIGQILVDVHRSSSKEKLAQFFDDMYKEGGYVTFHKESKSPQYFGGSKSVEYGFLRLDKEFFDFS